MQSALRLSPGKELKHAPVYRVITWNWCLAFSKYMVDFILCVMIETESATETSCCFHSKKEMGVCSSGQIYCICSVETDICSLVNI